MTTLEENQEISIEVSGEDYQECIRYSMNCWSNDKQKSHYNDGMLNTRKDTYKTERVGALGEMAFSLYVGLPVDFSYKKYGKEFDFKVGESLIDIKTSFGRSKYEISLLRCINEYDKYIRPNCNYYVTAYVESDNLEEGWAQVVLIGYHTLEQIIEQLPMPARSRYGRHQNYELSYHTSKPLKELKIGNQS